MTPSAKRPARRGGKRKLPYWNSLTNEQRTALIKVTDYFARPPGNGSQFALEFYCRVRELVPVTVTYSNPKPKRRTRG